MTSLMVIILLGHALRTLGDVPHQSERFEKTTDSSVLGFCPLFNSDCLIESRDKHLSGNHVTTELQLMELLQWNHVIIFYDQEYSDRLERIRAFPALASEYDLGEFKSSVEINELLQQLHETFFPRLHFVLLSSCSRALEVLRIVDRFDLESNRTTDFRHHSFWVVACYSPCDANTSKPPNLQQLENVILLFVHENGSSVVLRREPLSDGRVFSVGRCLGFFKTEQDVFPNTRYRLNNRKLIVSTVVHEPFLMEKDGGYEGYLIDLLDAIAVTLNFRYEIVHPADLRWGEEVDGRWDGLIGQLERREVDLVVAALTIHEDREKVMDFLYPPIFTFYDDIIYKVHSENTDNWQMYLKLFSTKVFIFLIVSLAASTVIGYIVLRFNDVVTESKSCSGTRKPRMFTITDTFFYMFGILLLRGLECNPWNQSARVTVFTWGIFSVVIAACFSANLVAIYAVQKPTLPFTSLGELVRQKEYKWGCVSGTIIKHILNKSRIGDMELAWDGVLKFNETDPEVLSDNISCHLAKVKVEKYALLVNRYIGERERGLDCNIHHVGQDIIWHQLGIGVPTDYPLKTEIENVLAVIMDSGLPDVWWRKWGNTNREACAEDTALKTLTFDDVLSIFCLLCLGLCAAVVALFIELIINKHNCR